MRAAQKQLMGAPWDKTLHNGNVSDAVNGSNVRQTRFTRRSGNRGIFPNDRRGGRNVERFQRGMPTGTAADWIKLAVSDPSYADLP